MAEEIEVPDSFPAVGDVEGKRIVITGAGRGLGRLLAHAFSRAGALVALVARSKSGIYAVAEALPGPALVFNGDVTETDFNESVADAMVSEWGGVDVWICNAGISPIVAGPLQTDPAVWRQVIDVNLTGAFLGARAGARVMRAGGRLIFTGSVLGERPREGLAAYSASKAGLVGMAKGLALDLASSGITVNVVAPGWFDSPLAEAWKSHPKLSARVLGHTALTVTAEVPAAGARAEIPVAPALYAVDGLSAVHITVPQASASSPLRRRPRSPPLGGHGGRGGRTPRRRPT
jgi:NAD(P)-dependent dehydrogenase (short-subunit alcohol dehydrogenase family)